MRSFDISDADIQTTSSINLRKSSASSWVSITVWLFSCFMHFIASLRDDFEEDNAKPGFVHNTTNNYTAVQQIVRTFWLCSSPGLGIDFWIISLAPGNCNSIIVFASFFHVSVIQLNNDELPWWSALFFGQCEILSHVGDQPYAYEYSVFFKTKSRKAAFAKSYNLLLLESRVQNVFW